MLTFKAIVRELFPPVTLRAYQRLRHPARHTFRGSFTSFADDGVFGSPMWLDVSQRKLDQSCSGERAKRSYEDFLALLVNQESLDRICRVLDFGGGTGFIFFQIRSLLLSPSSVEWHVVDNERLSAMGLRRRGDHRLLFHSSFSQIDGPFDLLFINTSVQYLDDWKGVLAQCLQGAPRYVVLTRLLCSNGASLVTEQRIHGYRSPCRFVARHEIGEFMRAQGYRPIYDAPCWEERLEDRLDPAIRQQLGRDVSRDIIFLRAPNGASLSQFKRPTTNSTLQT